MIRLAQVALASLLVSAISHAGPLDTFEQRCRALNGAFRANASDYQIENVAGNPTVARCSLQTGSEVYIGKDFVTAGTYTAFRPETIAQFQSACPGLFALSATPDASVGESQTRVYGHLMVICKLSE